MKNKSKFQIGDRVVPILTQYRNKISKVIFISYNVKHYDVICETTLITRSYHATELMRVPTPKCPKYLKTI